MMQHCAFAVDIWSYLVDITRFCGRYLVTFGQYFFFVGGGQFLVKPHWPPWRSDIIHTKYERTEVRAIDKL